MMSFEKVKNALQMNDISIWLLLRSLCMREVGVSESVIKYMKFGLCYLFNYFSSDKYVTGDLVD